MKKVGKIIFMMIFGALAVAAFGYVVMLLWNWLIPELFNGPVITYWQGFGLLALSKILFGSFGGGKRKCCCKNGGGWKSKWRSRCENMTPEERNEMKQKWKAKFERFCSEDESIKPDDSDEKVQS